MESGKEAKRHVFPFYGGNQDTEDRARQPTEFVGMPGLAHSGKLIYRELVAAAATAAAGAASPRRARRGFGRAAGDGRTENGKLDRGFLAGALGTGDLLLAVDDDFFKLRAAIVANIFVNGHSRLQNRSTSIAKGVARAANHAKIVRDIFTHGRCAGDNPRGKVSKTTRTVRPRAQAEIQSSRAAGSRREFRSQDETEEQEEGCPPGKPKRTRFAVFAVPRLAEADRRACAERRR